MSNFKAIDKPPSSALYIGLMSGTSLDAIDAALVRFDDSAAQPGDKLSLVHALERPYLPELREMLATLCEPGENEIDRMGDADQAVAQAFADAVQELLASASVSPSQVTAIGSHGQTIRHRPQAKRPFTLQIGDPNTIAERTGITTVADFRRRDMAAGGQGAPLVPAFHDHILSSDETPRQVINIGGISNITHVSYQDQAAWGYDIGPGNTLMDQWTQRHLQQPYDAGGEWAASGQVNSELLKRFLTEPFFQLAPPKSTGRELFNLKWLEEKLNQLKPATISPNDVQATLLQLTAQTISENIQTRGFDHGDVVVCGGGAYNKELMRVFSELLPGYHVMKSDDLNISSRYMEAMAFAWLAKETMHRRTGNLPSVTGASHPVVLGGIYF